MKGLRKRVIQNNIAVAHQQGTLLEMYLRLSLMSFSASPSRLWVRITLKLVICP